MGLKHAKVAIPLPTFQHNICFQFKEILPFPNCKLDDIQQKLCFNSFSIS